MDCQYTHITYNTQPTAVWQTLQSLHPIQLGEKLVDYTISDSCAVVAPPGGQRVELIKEQDARLCSLRPGANRIKKIIPSLQMAVYIHTHTYC